MVTLCRHRFCKVASSEILAGNSFIVHGAFAAEFKFFQSRGKRPASTDMVMKFNLATPSNSLLPIKDGVGSLS